MDLRFLSKLVLGKSTQIKLGLLCTLFILLTEIFNLPVASFAINRFDSFLYDEMIAFYHHPYQANTRVFIIDIDDVSIQKEGRWPWPRDKLAKLLIKLQESGVVTAGFDIIMAEPEINYALGLQAKLNSLMPTIPSDLEKLPAILAKLAPQVDNDQIFAKAMSDYDVVLGFLFHNLPEVQKGLLPPPLTNPEGKLLTGDDFAARRFLGYNASLDLFMQAAHHGGFVTNLPDPDGVIRQGLILSSFNNKLYPSLALMTAMRYLLADHVELKFRKSIEGRKLYGIEVGGVFIPTNSHAQILVPYWGPPFTLPFYSATDVLHDKIARSDLEGGIAVLGSSALMLSDLHPSPVARLFPGVEMVGNMITAMLNQQVATKYDWGSWNGIINLGLFGILFAVLLPFLGGIVRLFSTLTLIIGILASMVYLFVLHNLYVPAAYLLILIALEAISNYLYEFILVRRQRYKITQLFGQYVPETYVQELIDSPESSSMEGQTRHMTVLFSDIRSFTSTSEGLDAVGVRRLLNTFFTPLTEMIYNQQGTIDKYVGDMVMAFWGAPIPIANERHAFHAIMAALDIFNALPKINETMVENDLPPVNIGIGLGTGLMNVGDMGSKFRRAYTVLGDVVNLASRLESLTKFYGVNILVNDETRIGHDEFFWRIIDKVAVKGRLASLTIYEPLGLLEQISPDQIIEIEKYHKALDAYYAQDWALAESLFASLRDQYPETYLYHLYLARIDTFKSAPPAEGWDGVFVHTEK